MPVSRSGMKAPYDALRFLMQVDQADGEWKLVPEQGSAGERGFEVLSTAVPGGSPRLVGRGRACQAIVATQYARGTAANSAMIWTIVASDRRRFRFTGNCMCSTPPCREGVFSARAFGHRGGPKSTLAARSRQAVGHQCRECCSNRLIQRDAAVAGCESAGAAA